MMNCKFWRKRSWLNLRHYRGISLEGLRKIRKDLSQNSRSRSWDLNPGVLITRRHSGRDCGTYTLITVVLSFLFSECFIFFRDGSHIPCRPLSLAVSAVFLLLVRKYFILNRRVLFTGQSFLYEESTRTVSDRRVWFCRDCPKFHFFLISWKVLQNLRIAFRIFILGDWVLNVQGRKWSHASLSTKISLSLEEIVLHKCLQTIECLILECGFYHHNFLFMFQAECEKARCSCQQFRSAVSQNGVCLGLYISIL
jgi:hypothetical protein